MTAVEISDERARMPWTPVRGALADLRYKKRLTAEELAEKSGVSARTLYNLEKGEQKQIQVATLRKLMRSLRCADTELATWVTGRRVEDRLPARRAHWAPSHVQDVLLRLDADSLHATKLDTIIHRHVARVLKACDHKRALATQLLGISERQLEKLSGPADPSTARPNKTTKSV